MSDPHSPKFIIAPCEAAAISVPHHNTMQHTSQSLYVLSSPFLLLLDAIFASLLNGATCLSHKINEYSKEINDLAQLFSELYTIESQHKHTHTHTCKNKQPHAVRLERRRPQ